MKILGTNAFTHDAASALIADGRLVAMAEEERFNRVKHTGDFPEKSIEWCLRYAGLRMEDIDAVAYAWNPWCGIARRVFLTFTSNTRSLFRLQDQSGKWLNVINVPRKLRKMGFRGKFFFVNHYLAHSAGVFYPSGFKSAAVLTLDGVGEKATGSYATGKNLKIKKLRDILYPHSIGLFYAAITEYLGWRHNCDEGKTMGLAPFGKPVYLDAMRKMIKPDGRGAFRVDTRYFDFSVGWISKKFIEEFGPARLPDEPLGERHQNIAASAQALLEEILLMCANNLKRLTGEENLCYTGGVNLNCVANGRIQAESGFRRFYFFPPAYDAGASLGAALFVHCDIFKKPFLDAPIEHPHFGPCFTDDEVNKAIKEAGLKCEIFTEDALCKRVAKCIAEGKVVGWFQGRAEIGPRALGARSILADPRKTETKDAVNRKIKHREPFRPFAPSVPEEDAAIYFKAHGASPFMLSVASVRAEWRDKLPAITHIDGSARLQTISQNAHPRFYALHKEFKNLTNISVLLNTSFNVMGKPMVNTPQEALEVFIKSDMDALALENTFLIK